MLLNQAHVNADKHEGKTIEQLRAELVGQDRRERRDPPLRALRGRRVGSGPDGGNGEPAFRRVLLKLSGEALMGDLEYGADPERLAARSPRRSSGVHDRGVEVAIVVGGGNIYRGLDGRGGGHGPRDRRLHGHARDGPQRARAAGRAREARASHTRVQSAITIAEVAEPYIRRRAMRHLEKGRVVIFAAGTGNPFFTTDTAAALRALEIHAEAILMAKNGVEGVYTADPREDPDASSSPRSPTWRRSSAACA